MLPQEMSSDLMVENSDHSAFPIFAWEFDVHLAFSSLWVMSHTSRRYLILLKVYRDPLFNSEVLKVVSDVFMSFFLVQLFPLSVEIRTLRSILLQEAVEDLLGYPEVLAIWLIKLLEELLGKLSIFVFKLMVNLKVRLKESLVALLKIFG